MSGALVIPEQRRFFLYMLFAWGCSFVFTVIVITLDSVAIISDEYKPGIGVGSCFLKGMYFVHKFETLL